MENNKKVLLSIKDLVVRFSVRGRKLTAIRGISLDIYENESIAIVGESGSGKSVFTKTFAGMLDSNGSIDNGKIIFDDEELADTKVSAAAARRYVPGIKKKLDEYSRLELGAETYKKITELESEKKRKFSLSDSELTAYEAKEAELKFQRTEAFNLKQTIDPKDKAQMKKVSAEIALSYLAYDLRRAVNLTTPKTGPGDKAPGILMLLRRRKREKYRK